MATAFLSFIPSPLSPSTSASPLSSLTTSLVYLNNQNLKRRPTLCKVFNESPPPSPALTKRGFSFSLISSLILAGNSCCNIANAAILEAEDDEELLEKVKRDRKKRLERQGKISSSDQEKG